MFAFEKDSLAEREEAEGYTEQLRGRTDMGRERVELARERTRLANKRTFLAWCRTALGFMAFGFLLEKIGIFFLTEHLTSSKVLLQELGYLGKLAFVGGPVLIVLAGWSFIRLERELGFKKSNALFFATMMVFCLFVCAAVLFVFKI